MFLVEVDLRLGTRGAPLTEDEVTDMIERLIDDLDHLPIEPDIGTVRVGEDIDMTIGVVIDKDDEFAALQEGAALIAASLQRAGIARADVLTAGNSRLRTSVRTLEPA